jgi:hypothetical protein
MTFYQVKTSGSVVAIYDNIPLALDHARFYLENVGSMNFEVSIQVVDMTHNEFLELREKRL